MASRRVVLITHAARDMTSRGVVVYPANVTE